jgi:hypothetical protein
VPIDVWEPKVCAGGAMLAPWDSGTLDTLLGKADQEMYLRRALRRGGPRSRAQAAAAQAAPPPLPSVGGSFFSSSGRSSVYHIAVVAETETGTSVRVEAVIDLRNAQAGQAARWLAWREGQ